MYKLPGKQILSLGTFKDLVELSKLKFFWVLRDKLADAHASPELESCLVFPSIFPHKGKNLERVGTFLTSKYMDHHYLKRHKVA